MPLPTGIVVTSDTGNIELGPNGEIRITHEGVRCCQEEYIQAKLCENGLVDIWFPVASSGSGAVITYDPCFGGSTTSPLPFHFKLCEPLPMDWPYGADTIYEVAQGNPVRCTPGNTYPVIQVGSCCNCPGCPDGFPPAFDFALEGLQVFQGVWIFLSISPASSATWHKTIASDTGTVNGCLDNEADPNPGGPKFNCTFAKTLPDSTEGGQVIVKNYGTVILTEGFTYDQGGARDELYSSTTTYNLFVAVQRVGNRWVGTVFMGPYRLFYGEIETEDCTTEISIPNWYTEYTIPKEPGVPIAPSNGGGTVPFDDSTLVVGNFGGNLGRRGFIKITPRADHCIDTFLFVPKYRLVVTGSTGQCSGGGPPSYQGVGSVDGAWDHLSIGGNTPPAPLATVRKYAGASDCTGGFTVEPQDDPVITLTGTFKDGGGAGVELFQNMRSLIFFDQVSVTCENELVAGYPRKIVLTTSSSLGELFAVGIATLTLENGP